MGFAIFDAVLQAGTAALLALENAIIDLAEDISAAAKQLDATAAAGEAPTATAENSVSVMMLKLQKYVAEWTIVLGISTGLLKSLSDGLEGVARNI